MLIQIRTDMPYKNLTDANQPVRFIDADQIAIASRNPEGKLAGRLKGSREVVEFYDEDAFRDFVDPILAVVPAAPGTEVLTHDATGMDERGVVSGRTTGFERTPVLAWRVRKDSVSPVVADPLLASTIASPQTRIGYFAIRHPNGVCDVPCHASFPNEAELLEQWQLEEDNG